MTPDTKVIDFKIAQLERASRSLKVGRQPLSPPIAGGGSLPHDAGMEARMSAIEADTREVKEILQLLEPLLTRVDNRTHHIEADALKVRTSLAELDGRVSQLPRTTLMLAFVLAVLALAELSKYIGH